MNTKGKVLIVGSSSDTLELKDGRNEPTGYYLNELAVPAQAIIDAGYEIVLATPKSTTPVVDQHSVVPSPSSIFTPKPSQPRFSAMAR